MVVSVELVVEGQVANGGKNNPGKKYKQKHVLHMDGARFVGKKEG